MALIVILRLFGNYKPTYTTLVGCISYKRWFLKVLFLWAFFLKKDEKNRKQLSAPLIPSLQRYGKFLTHLQMDRDMKFRMRQIDTGAEAAAAGEFIRDGMRLDTGIWSGKKVSCALTDASNHQSLGAWRGQHPALNQADAAHKACMKPTRPVGCMPPCPDQY